MAAVVVTANVLQLFGGQDIDGQRGTVPLQRGYGWSRMHLCDALGGLKSQVLQVPDLEQGR
jgi:hypothetical protein